MKTDENYKPVFIQGAKSRIERLIENNVRAILRELPQGNQFRLTGNGRILRKTQNNEDSEVDVPINHSERSKIPDHSILLAEFKTLTNISEYSSSKIDKSKRFRLKSIPNDFFGSDLQKAALQTLIQRIETTRETQSHVDNIYSDLCTLIVDEMNCKIPIYDASRKTRKRHKSSKPFWNEELGQLWNAMRLKEKQFLSFKGRSSTRRRFREEFQHAQKSFDRKLRQCERHYRQSFCLEIDNMVTSNPNDFWDKIKKLGPRKVQNIPMEVYGPNGEILTDDDSVLNRWKTDFHNIYNMDNSTAEFNDNFHSQVLSHKSSLEDCMIDPLYDENPELNTNITIDEIRRLILGAKNGKACGIDSIPYEVLKYESVISVLHSLFQLIFETSIIPSIWRQAIICPILKDKTSDERSPLNYRGISLLSCISKLYSAFINSRLSAYLETNDMLVDEQNGFRAHRSHVKTIFSH
ncbi:Hypothetical predicted protein [Mytilus galloprovincialis]|uniref:Reverse transcriptase domain-containing protein n=1 Tax=Mytilus galloprovincialis TaxID=29158 RepID=A0A8B6EW20_MYTGA|nr:Hypothetical predicted protein [Mytilus galloprovincialis]